jgi:hypothetical protein
MDAKAVLGFFADILYIKGLICFDEFETIMDAKNDVDLGIIVERMLSSDFNLYKRGESYGTLIK